MSRRCRKAKYTREFLNSFGGQPLLELPSGFDEDINEIRKRAAEIRARVEKQKAERKAQKLIK